MFRMYRKRMQHWAQCRREETWKQKWWKKNILFYFAKKKLSKGHLDMAKSSWKIHEGNGIFISKGKTEWSSLWMGPRLTGLEIPWLSI